MLSVFRSRIAALTAALQMCADWARNSLMIFSADKTNSMLFGSSSCYKHLIPDNQAEFSLLMSQLQLRSPTGEPWTLTPVQQYSYMGINFSQQTNAMFDNHCKKVLVKLSAAAIPLRRLLDANIPQNIGETLLKSLVLPIAFYGLEFTRFSTQGSIEALHRSIANIARDVLHTPHHVRETDVFLQLNLLPMQYQQEYQLIQFFNRITDYNPSRLTRLVFIEDLHSSMAFRDNQMHQRKITMQYGSQLLLMTGLYVWPHSIPARPFNWPGAAGPPQLLSADIVNDAIQARPDRKSILRSARDYLSRVTNVETDTAKPISALDKMMNAQPDAGMLVQYQQWMQSIPRIRPVPLLDRRDRLQHSLHAFMQPVNQPAAPVAVPNRPAAPPSIPKLPNSTRERYIRVDRGLTGHIRTRIRLDKLPTMENLQHYYEKQFNDRGYSTLCRACSRQRPPVPGSVPPPVIDPPALLSFENQTHIFLECQCAHIRRHRLNLRRKLMRFNLPLTLAILGGQLNSYKLKDSAVASVLEWTGQFITAVCNRFQFSLMKTWVPFFRAPSLYFLGINDFLPP